MGTMSITTRSWRRRVLVVCLLLLVVSIGAGVVVILILRGSPTVPPLPGTPTSVATPHALLWNVDNARKFFAPRPPPVPRPDGGLVIIAEGQPNGRITLAQAFAPNGALQWTTTASGTITSLVMSQGGSTYFIGDADPAPAIAAVDDAGTRRWRTAMEAPVLHLAEGGGRIAARLGGDAVVLLDSAGQIVWRQTVEGVLAGPEWVGTDRVVVSTRDGTVQALRAADGAPAWMVTLDSSDLSALATGPTGDVFATHTGGVTVLDTAGQVRWRWARAGTRVGPPLVAFVGLYLPLAEAAQPDQLTVAGLDFGGHALRETRLPGRLADTRLFTTAGCQGDCGVYVQIARRVTYIGACGGPLPITFPQAADLDAFLPLATRTYVASDDHLFALAGGTWGQRCP